ncbi:hypothetical protein ScPMuIL_001995 [Solemya velum]
MLRDCHKQLIATNMADVSATFIKTCANLKENEGKQALAKHFKLEEKHIDNDVRNSVHVDFLYGNMVHAVEKGFKWHQVAAVVNFSEKLLQETIGKSLLDSVSIFKKISEELLSVLEERNFSVFSEFIFQTYMTHFSLYQLVFRHEQEVSAPCAEQTVEVPVPPLPLKDSKEESVWYYEETLGELEQRECKETDQRIANDRANFEETEQKKSDILKDLEEKESSFNKEVIGEMLRETFQKYTTLTVDSMKHNISSVMSDLELKLEKTSLPRPQQLGPPPRFELKPKILTPAQTKVGKELKEPKEEKRPRSRSAKSAKRR